MTRRRALEREADNAPSITQGDGRDRDEDHEPRRNATLSTRTNRPGEFHCASAQAGAQSMWVERAAEPRG